MSWGLIGALQSPIGPYRSFLEPYRGPTGPLFNMSPRPELRLYVLLWRLNLAERFSGHAPVAPKSDPGSAIPASGPDIGLPGRISARF